MISTFDGPVDTVTNAVQLGALLDEECVIIRRCVCGREFYDGEETLSIYNDKTAWKCPGCGVKLFFGIRVQVYKQRED